MRKLLLILITNLFTQLAIAQEYKGSTINWGDFLCFFDATVQKGALQYDNLLNPFIFQKSGDAYIVKGLNKGKEFAIIEYRYDNNSKKLKLQSTPKLNAHFFNKKAVNRQKNIGVSNVEKDKMQEQFGALIYDIFKEKYRNQLANSLANKVVFFENGDAYIGGVNNNELHGKGVYYTEIETQKGHWENGLQNGAFELSHERGTGTAYFENGKKEGAWTMSFFDGGKVEVVFKNDEKVSSRVVEAPPKKEWNPKMLNYFNTFLSELSNPTAIQDLVSKQAQTIRDSRENGNEFSLRSMQLMVRPLKYKVDAHISGLNAAEEQLDKMIEEAELVACDKTLLHLKQIEKKFHLMRDAYINARFHYKEQEFTKDHKVYSDHINKGGAQLSAGFDAYNNLVPYVNSFEEFPCYKTKIVNPKPIPVQKKVYSVGLFLSDNETGTEITISNVSGVAEKAGIEKGDKLLYIDESYIASLSSSVVHKWLRSTNPDKEYKITYFDASSKERVVVYLKPASYEFKELERKGTSNYIENGNWGDKKYTGELYLNVPHGKGKITFPNGDVYEGELDQGELMNQGTMTYADGSVYKGGWHLDQKHGPSVFITATGIEHHGEYVRGKKSAHFYVVDNNDNIVMEYYDGDNGRLLFTKKKTLAEAAKYIGREGELGAAKETASPITRTPLSTNTPSKTSPTKEAETNTIVGVGLYVKQVVGRRVFVQKTESGWAARKTRIGEGDVLLEIDGKPVKGLTKSGIDRLLSGAPGTSVTIKYSLSRAPNTIKTYRLYRGKDGKAELINDSSTATTKTATSTRANKTTNTQATTTIPKKDTQTTTAIPRKVDIGIIYFKISGTETCRITRFKPPSTAYKAGLREGDNILKINGISLVDKSYKEINALLEGMTGTSIKLTIQRDGALMDFSFLR